jgi:hypothetical protein
MDQAKKNAIDSLKAPLDVIAQYEPSVLAEGKDLGAINFRAGQELFQKAVELAKEFRSLPLDLLPIQTLQQLKPPADQMAKGLKEIAAFTLVGQPNPEAQRNALLSNMQSWYDQAFLALTPHLAYLSLKSAQVQETMRRSAELLEDTQKKVSADMKEIEQKKAEIDSIVKAARDAAAKIGVAQFATKFEEISDEHAKASKQWLLATAGLGLVTVGVAIGLLFFLPPLGQMNDPATIQRIITKLVLISIFYFAALWASRNYRAHRHLSVVNKHRQSALSTFETFVKSASDDQTKNAVLLEATHCIFSSACTGYLGGEEENPSSRIIEILRTVGSSVGK